MTLKFRNEEELRLRDSAVQLVTNVTLSAEKQSLETRQCLITCLSQGLDVSYGKLSISNLGRGIPRKEYLNKKYQVDCQAYGIHYSDIFNDMNVAIDKFMILKAVLDDPNRSRPKEANRAMSEVSPETKNFSG